MGYRSDVGLALTKCGVERLTESLAKSEAKTREAVNNLLDSPDKYLKDSSGAEAYIWRLYKWYDQEPQDYPEVEFFRELFRKMDCSDYLFIRIGDNLDDSETNGTFYSNPFGMRIVRAIEIEGNLIGSKE